MLNKITLLSFLFFLFVSLQAQDADKGWEWIEKGEFVKAQSAFTSVLKADSSNEKALLGALFLSDVAHDSRLFEKLARKLIHVAPRDAYFQAFFDEFFQIVIETHRVVFREAAPGISALSGAWEEPTTARIPI